jgi:hypothetical protein
VQGRTYLGSRLDGLRWGTETVAIFVIQDDRCHAQKGSIELFWVGFPVKLHASLRAALSMAGFPRAHNLPKEGFGIRFLLW